MLQAAALGVSKEIKLLHNKLHDGINTKQFSVFSKGYFKEAKKDIAFLHTQNLVFLIGIYINYAFCFFLFIFTFDNDRIWLPVIIAQLVVIGACNIMPAGAIIIYYIIFAAISLLLFVFEIIAFIILLVAIILFSPFICCYLHCSEKNALGQT